MTDLGSALLSVFDTSMCTMYPCLSVIRYTVACCSQYNLWEKKIWLDVFSMMHLKAGNIKRKDVSILRAYGIRTAKDIRSGVIFKKYGIKHVSALVKST